MENLCYDGDTGNPAPFSQCKGFGAAYDGFMTVTTILLWISVILTVVSLVDYLIKNKDVMKEEDKD